MGQIHPCEFDFHFWKGRWRLTHHRLEVVPFLQGHGMRRGENTVLGPPACPDPPVESWVGSGYRVQNKSRQNSAPLPPTPARRAEEPLPGQLPSQRGEGVEEKCWRRWTGWEVSGREGGIGGRGQGGTCQGGNEQRDTRWEGLGGAREAGCGPEKQVQSPKPVHNKPHSLSIFTWKG